jgi:hypothetical protein
MLPRRQRHQRPVRACRTLTSYVSAKVVHPPSAAPCHARVARGLWRVRSDSYTRRPWPRT